MKQKSVALIAVDVRSLHNVGSLFRTCDGFSAELWLTGITPRPIHQGDERLPHVAKKAHDAIHKTALGAEQTVPWQYATELTTAVKDLRAQGYTIVALEQSPNSQRLSVLSSPRFASTSVAIVVGREVEGLSEVELALCDAVVEITMMGGKESFNVSVAAGIALYEIRRQVKA